MNQHKLLYLATRTHARTTHNYDFYFVDQLLWWLFCDTILALAWFKNNIVLIHKHTRVYTRARARADSDPPSRLHHGEEFLLPIVEQARTSRHHTHTAGWFICPSHSLTHSLCHSVDYLLHTCLTHITHT